MHHIIWSRFVVETQSAIGATKATTLWCQAAAIDPRSLEVLVALPN